MFFLSETNPQQNHTSVSDVVFRKTDLPSESNIRYLVYSLVRWLISEQSKAKQSKANARRWRSRCIPLSHTSDTCIYDVNPCIHDSMITHTGTHQLSAKPKTIALPMLPSSSLVCLAAIFLYLPHRHRLCSMCMCMCVCAWYVGVCVLLLFFWFLLCLYTDSLQHTRV